MPLNRRTFLERSAAAGAGVAIAGSAALPAEAAEATEQDHGRGRPPKRYSFTVMGTTDLHGNVFNWDYFTDKEFDDKAHNDVGLAKISTLVEKIRAQVKTWIADPGVDTEIRSSDGSSDPGPTTGGRGRPDRPHGRGVVSSSGVLRFQATRPVTRVP